MPNRNMSDNIKIDQTIEPDNYTTNNTTIAGSGVDTLGFDAVTCSISVGTWNDSGTDGWEFGLQESDSLDSGYSDVADTDMSYTITGDSTVSGAIDTGVFAKIDDVAEDDAVYTSDYLGNKRYVRIKANATGNQTSGTGLDGTIILGKPADAKTGANRSS